jgi:hypothetical protein
MSRLGNGRHQHPLFPPGTVNLVTDMLPPLYQPARPNQSAIVCCASDNNCRSKRGSWHKKGRWINEEQR